MKKRQRSKHPLCFLRCASRTRLRAQDDGEKEEEEMKAKTGPELSSSLCSCACSRRRTRGGRRQSGFFLLISLPPFLLHSSTICLFSVRGSLTHAEAGRPVTKADTGAEASVNVLLLKGGTKVETTSSLPSSVAEMGFLMACTTEAGSRVGCSTDEVVGG